MTLQVLPENHLDTATLTVTPSAVSTFPITNLQSNVRDRVWRSPNLDQQVIKGHWDGNVRVVSAWGIWPSASVSCLIGAKVRLELFSDAAWTTSVYDSGTLDFFTWNGSAYGVAAYGEEPYGTDPDDRSARLAAFVRVLSQEYIAGSFRITITNGGAVDTPYFEARRIWLARTVAGPYAPNHGAAPAWATNSSQQRTWGGSLRRNARAKWRTLEIEIVLDSEEHRRIWNDILGFAGIDREIVLVTFANEQSYRERDFTVMGSLTVLNPATWQAPLFFPLRLSITES